jgi:Zn-dependent M28 family amino/carboxypeptidase
VSAHLDGRAAGGAADDDASGCALVLEAARVFAAPDVQTDVSIRFIWWGNEETGLNGSNAYVANRAGLQGREEPPGSGIYPEPTWLGIIQHDMILYDHGNPAQVDQIAGADIDVEYRAGTTYAALSQGLANKLKIGSYSYSSDYPAEVGDSSQNTDDTPFHNYTASVSVRENRRCCEIYGVHPYYHTANDLYQNYSDLDFLLGFNTVQMTVGTVAELAGAHIVAGVAGQP